MADEPKERDYHGILWDHFHGKKVSSVFLAETEGVIKERAFRGLLQRAEEGDPAAIKMVEDKGIVGKGMFGDWTGDAE